MNQTNIIKKQIKLKGFIRSPKKEDFIKSLLLVICQRASFFGFFPFGNAYFMSVGDADAAYLYIPALAAGIFLSNANPAKYIISSLIIWLYKIIIPKEHKNIFLNSAVCAAALFMSGLYLALRAPAIKGFLMLLFEAVTTFFGCCIFSNAHNLFTKQKNNEQPTRDDSVSVIIGLAIIMLGLSGIYLPFSMDFRTIMGIYLILCITMYSDYTISVLFALVCGFLTNPDNPAAMVCASVFAASSFFSSFLKCFGQVGATIGFLTGITVCILFLGDTSYLPVSLVDIFAASAVFAFIPLRFHQHIGIFLANTLKPGDIRRDFRIKEYITEELNSISNTFSEFSRQFTGSFQRAYENDSDNPSRIFDETAERICTDCSRCNDCWHKNFNDTYKYMFEIYNTMSNTGHCSLHEAPLIFTQRCIQPELFLNEFNHVYELSRQNELNKGTRKNERQLVSNQYVEISKIIGRLSEEIEGNFFFDEQKEKQILSECTKEAVYLRDLNVIKNSEGYYEVFFVPGNENETDKICDIVSEILEVKMKNTYCKNKSIVKLICDSSFRVKVSVTQKKKDDEPVSGDTVIHFETEQCKYYVILCDGMGSGCDASRESRMTAELLGGFLKAGFTKSAALNLINSTLALKMDREGFSTIDLCEIDLRSGKCEFVKIGGAQSFVKSGDSIRIISAKGLPAGILEEINPDNIECTLADNDMIVMVSDGVSEAGYGMMRGEWIKRLMGVEGIENDELSKSIVNSARKKIYPRTPDDMTAIVITIHKITDEIIDNDEKAG